MLISKPGKTLTPRHGEVQQTTSLSPREPVLSPDHPKLKKTRSLSRSSSAKDLTEEAGELSSELSIDDKLPGVIKIFGESVLPGAEYKSVLASTRSTSQELVKQALERYGQPSSLYVDYVLCDVIGLVETADINFSQRASKKWRTVCRRVLDDVDKPLELQSFWKPSNGFSRRYELLRKVEVVKDSAADDTLGLNDNARKIMMAKVAPGAIPLSSTWSGELSDFRLQIHGGRSPCKDNMSDDSGTNSSDSGQTHYPFLLTLRGFDTSKDQICYRLKSKCTKIGRFRGHQYASEIGLDGPDVLPLHCSLNLRDIQPSGYFDNRYNFYLEMDIHEGAYVTLNGERVSITADIHPGDIVTIGSHYLFLYKDPTGGYDVPAKLPWYKPSSVVSTMASPRIRAPITDFLDATGGDFSASFDASEAGAGGSDGHQLSFAYSKDKEDELLKAITDVYCCSKRDHPLSSALLLAACMDHAQRKFTRHHLKNLQRRILFSVREKVADLAKILSNRKYESSLFDFNTPTADHDPLKVLIYWMSNSVHLYVHVLHDFHVHCVNLDPDDDVHAGLQEMVSGLEDVVSFSFQQTVYCVTKILYHMVGKILDSNPFSSSEAWERDGIGQVISVLQTTRNAAADLKLHSDVMTQLMTYLLFFISTSLFNRLITAETEKQFYNWTFGVRLQANLSRLEEWSASIHLDREFHQVSQPLVAVADFLAMSKNMLMKMDWPAFRSQFTSLNESHLLKLLHGYHLGGNKAPPQQWFPPEGAVSKVNDEDLPIKLASHSIFTLPKEGCPMDLSQNFPEGFLQYIEHFQNLYGAEDDDSDSGLSVSNTPRLPETRSRETRTFFNIDSPRIGAREIPERQSRAPNRLPPPRPSRSSSNVRSPNRNQVPSHQWRARSQERPPIPKERTRFSDSGSVKNIFVGASSPSRKPLPRVPPLDLATDSSSPFSQPRRISKSQSSDNLLGHKVTNGSGAPLLKSSLAKSPRSPGARARVHIGPVNYKDITTYPDDAYVEVQKINQGQTPKNLRVLPHEDQTKVGFLNPLSTTYNSLSPRNRNSLPYDNDLGYIQEIKGDIITVCLDRGNTQLGLGLIDGLHTPLRTRGIYVKNLLLDSPAYHCGQLHIGDRILAINGHNIVGEEYQSSMKLFRTSGSKLQLLVEKSDNHVVDKIAAAVC